MVSRGEPSRYVLRPLRAEQLSCSGVAMFSSKELTADSLKIAKLQTMARFRKSGDRMTRVNIQNHEVPRREALQRYGFFHHFCRLSSHSLSLS